MANEKIEMNALEKICLFSKGKKSKDKDGYCMCSYSTTIRELRDRYKYHMCPYAGKKGMKVIVLHDENGNPVTLLGYECLRK